MTTHHDLLPRRCAPWRWTGLRFALATASPLGFFFPLYPFFEFGIRDRRSLLTNDIDLNLKHPDNGCGIKDVADSVLDPVLKTQRCLLVVTEYFSEGTPSIFRQGSSRYSLCFPRDYVK